MVCIRKNAGLLPIAVSLTLSFLAAHVGLLAQNTYTGATSASWSVNGNWSLGLEPTAADDVIFPAVIPATGGTITLAAGELANSLSFLNSYTLTGGNLTLTTGNVSVDPTFNAAISSVLQGTAGLTKSGGGTLTLSGANTFTGTVSISAGTLSIAANNNLGATANSVAFTGNSTLAVTTGFTSARAVSVATSVVGTVDVATSQTFRIDGVVSGAGTLTKVGNGTLVLGNAANTISTITMSSGILALESGGSLGNASTVNFNGGTIAADDSTANSYTIGTLNIGGDVRFGSTTNPAFTGGQTFSGTTVNLGGATRTLNIDEDVTFTGEVGNGAIIKTGDDFLVFSNANNTFTSYTVNAGETRIGASGNVLGTGLVTFNVANARLRSTDGTARSIVNNVVLANTTVFGSTGTGDLTIGKLDDPGQVGDDSTTIDINGSTNRTITVENLVTTFIAPVVNGSGITKSGAGSLVFLNTNTQTGNIQINTGNITVMGTLGRLSAGNGFTIVGDNNGNDESLTVGDVTDGVSGTVDRVADAASLRFNGSTPITFNGPAVAITEVFTTLEYAAGVGVLTLNPATGGEIQLNITNLTRSANAMGVIRGTGLGLAAGTANSTRLIVSTPLSTIGAGGTGANTSIIPFLIGGSSATAAPDTFLTYHATNGVTLLTNADYTSTIAGSHGQNASIGAAENVTTDVSINALRVTPGGSAVLGTGADLVVRSGAMLVTGSTTISGPGTITLGESLVNANGLGRQGLIFVSGDTTPITLNIDANLGTAGGLLVGDAGNTGHTIVLSGDNKIIGGIVVNGGTLRAGSAGALNDNILNDLILRAGNSSVDGATSTAFQLFGNNVAVIFAGNDRLQGSTRIQNGAATDATLTILASVANSDSNDGVLENGAGGGVLNLAKRGAFRVQLESNNTYTGTTEIHSGDFRVAGTGGRLSGTTSITVRGGSFYTTKQSDQNVDRVNDAAVINLHNGSFQFDQNQSAFNSAETVGALNVLNGDNSIVTDFAATAQTSTLTFASLNVSSGAALNFTTFGTAGDIFIGEGGGANDDNRVIFTSDPATTAGGIMGGNIYHTRNFNVATTQDVVNFAGYDADVDAGGSDVEVGVVAFSAYNTGAETGWSAGTVANPTASVTLTDSRTIEAIRLGGGIGITMSAGQVLNLSTGGLLHNGTDSTITGGTLTAGGASAGGELFIRTEDNLTTSTLTISSVIADNGGTVSVTKTGPDNLVLSGANTYTGRTTLSGGTVSFTADNNFGAAPASATAGHLRLYGVTLAQTATTGTVTLNGNRGLELGGGANVISTAGTSNLVYNTMGITSNGDAGLTLIGDIDMTIGGNTTIGGNFVIQTGGSNITLGGSSNFIGGSLVVGTTPGVTNFVYNVANGTLSVGTNSPNTSNLDVGVRSGTDVTNVLTNATLDLRGSANFIANVDRFRIGVLTNDPNPDIGNRGNVFLSTNAAIVANTDVLISDSPNDGLATTPSNLTFGSGVSSLTSRLITVGGRKGAATLDIAAGGTLNLGGFGERMLDLAVARQNLSTGVTNVGTLDFSVGTLNASIDEFYIADRAGGGNGGSTGTVTLGNSAHNVVANSMVVGRMVAGAASGTALAQGTYSQAGGSTMVMGDILLGSHDGTASATAKGTLNITGGVFTVGGNIFKAGTTRSSSIINVDGGTLDLQNQEQGDTTKGTFSGSLLTFRSGSIVDAESVTLDGVSVSSGTVIGTEENALILGDVTVDFDVLLTLVQDGMGGILYDGLGGGSGAVINGDINLGGSVRDINVLNSAGATAELTIAGQISNSGTVNKQGDGTLVLTNASNTHGSTIVNEGVLQVGQGGVGSTGTGLTYVAFGATLAGTGTVTAQLPSVTTHIIDGTISPGDLAGSALGELKFQGNLTLNSAADATFQLSNPANAYDRITGTSSNDTIILDGTINAAEVDDSFFGGYGVSWGDTWFLLMDWTTINLAGFNVGTNLRSGADGIAEGDLDLPTLGSGLLWDVSNFSINGSISVVPEPGRAMLLFFGVAALFMRRRRLGR